MFGPCFVVQYLVSFIVLQTSRCFTIFAVCLCYVSLHHGVVGWSAVCDFGIFAGHSHLFFMTIDQ